MPKLWLAVCMLAPPSVSTALAGVERENADPPLTLIQAARREPGVPNHGIRLEPKSYSPSAAELLSPKEFTQQRGIHRLLLGERVEVLEHQGLFHWESGWFILSAV